MIRKSLLLILVLALLSVPVFLMAHAFTHFVEVDTISVTNAESAHVEDDHDIDVDDICLDCLALTGLSSILVTLGFLLVRQTTLRLLAQLIARHHHQQKSSPYSPRGPPLTSVAIF